MKVRALRGGITADANDKEQIIGATSELVSEMIERNELDEDDVIFVIFTATKDLTAEFPAAAVRKLGLGRVPVLCARELDIEGSLGNVIRVMMLINTEKTREQLRHVYLKEARQLRTDLPE